MIESLGTQRTYTHWIAGILDDNLQRQGWDHIPKDMASLAWEEQTA